jgi:hypothetical protein
MLPNGLIPIVNPPPTAALATRNERRETLGGSTTERIPLMHRPHGHAFAAM